MKKLVLYLLLSFTFFGVNAQEEIKMNKEPDGIFTIPCEVNGLRLRFILDTGASAVCLSMTEANFMYKNGYLSEDDFIGVSKSLLASGQIVEDYTVNLKEVKVGSKIIKNVLATIDKGLSAPLLLGQSVLSQLGEWSIRDNYLILRDRPGSDFSKYTVADWRKRIEDVKNSLEWDKSIRYLMPGVLADDYNTIITVGDMVSSSYGGNVKIDPNDEEIVVEKLKKLSDSNDKDATFLLAYIYENRARNLSDFNYAIRLYEKLIDGKSLYKYSRSSVYNSAYINLHNIYNKINQPEKAIDILQKGALLNESDCISYLFGIYEDKKQYQNLYQWATKLSQTCTGYSKAKALYRKANCLIEGRGVSKNVSQGIQLLKQIVNTQNSYEEEVLFDLCDYYLNKDNKLVVEYANKISYPKFFRNFYLGYAYYLMKDYSSARLYFKDLLKKQPGRLDLFKLGLAICSLGRCYEEGLGGAISYKDAENCYMYAYEECKFFGALGFLGDMYSNDKIYKEPNYEVAFGCYLQGAKNDDPYCCYMVSQYYKSGVGTNEDIKESEFWQKKAKENGWE